MRKGREHCRCHLYRSGCGNRLSGELTYLCLNLYTLCIQPRVSEQPPPRCFLGADACVELSELILKLSESILKLRISRCRSDAGSGQGIHWRVKRCLRNGLRTMLTPKLADVVPIRFSRARHGYLIVVERGEHGLVASVHSCRSQVL